MQIFSIVQYANMVQLVWNVKTYLYDLRVMRYLAYFFAIAFIATYTTATAILMDLMFVKGKHAGSDRAVDLMFALFIGYNLVEFFPTAFTNTFIILKELTMN